MDPHWIATAFSAVNSIRVVFYLPQIVAVATDAPLEASEGGEARWSGDGRAAANEGPDGD